MMDEYGNEEKKGMSATAIVLIVVGILVGLAVVGGLFMGVIFLWAESFTSDTGGEVENLNLRASIDSAEDILELEVMSGNVYWGEYRVMVDSQEVITVYPSSGAGETAVFSGLMWDPEPGTEYNVKIINIVDNKVVWEDDVIATQ